MAGHFGLVAQSEEQPVVCGKAEGASPFGSAIIYRSVAQSLERPAWDREGTSVLPPRWKSCHSDHFNSLSWSKISGIRLLSGTMQVKTLSAAPLPDSVKVARRPVKPCGVGASPTLAGACARPIFLGGRRSHAATKMVAPVAKTGSV